MEGRRRARFRREPGRMGFVLTARDRDIVRLVAQHRYLRSVHVLAWFGSRMVLYRLQALYHEGYLERVRFGRRDGKHGGGVACVYRLARRGTELLREEPAGRLAWLTGTQGRQATIAHALLVSDFMVNLALACQAAGVPMQAKPVPRVSVRAWHAERPWWLTVVPDAAFALGETLYLLEADRGTMPVRRRGLRETSVFRKLVGYFEAWRQLVFERRFGWRRVRVLVMTNNRERLMHMVGMCRGLNGGKGSGLFLFAESVAASSKSVLDAEMWTGRGEVMTLGGAVVKPVVEPVEKPVPPPVVRAIAGRPTP